eukprot:CAMPEP_0113299772 /NCGR_PEP_ID=MMETSP0010_2-20120614/1671_1 /TAXON_ID=216773 ORGANISM="Corethron hystrix, Strain 308" /NCGR_SAMPLE_ID=MMETSP0010_2 /ASSEMBLY_ACC=CAM_ASM_000155 /LENGTH=421 /DNA_ID=CAMNT_0000153069 /DNA_START=352 /DNA_END=1617 /DNA_ORIENTATION=- /assembly_acc=CAM_ASM_000155
MNGLESAIRLEDGTKDQLLKHTIREEDVHQSSQHPQERQPSFEELWNPDRFAFLLAFLAISPFVLLIGYEMKIVSIPYLFLQFFTVPLAFRLRDCNGYIRWILGFFTICLLSSIKTASLISSSSAFSIKIILIAFTAFWECSNAAIIFGGRTLQNNYGIASYSTAFLAGSCPAQIKFIQEQNNQYIADGKKKWIERSFHMLCYLLAFLAFSSIFHLFSDRIEAWPILEAEGIVIYLSCMVHIWNIPPHLYQLLMNLRNDPDTNSRIQVIYPYGSIYFSTSSREFWRKWGRPASSLIRHMFYYPLGGSRRPWLSIPIMFLLNASGHYDISMALVGDRAEIGWNIVFGVLGLVATMEVLCDSYFITTSNSADANDGSEERASAMPKWWYGIRFIMATASFRFAAYTLVHKCLHLSLSDILVWK